MLVVFGADGGLGSAILPLLSELDCIGLNRGDCNIENENDVARFFEQLKPQGPLHVLNATGKLHSNLLVDQPACDARDMLDSTVMGAFHLLKHFPVAAPPGSSMVMLSSVVGTVTGVAGAVMYGACKGAIESMTRSAAKEYGKLHLSVSCIRMGYFEAGMIDKVPPRRQDILRKIIPSGRWGHVAELAALVQYAFDWPYANGSVLELHGGIV